MHIKIKDIKGKAEQSELMVQEICRDIKQLDFAKRNLMVTITALKNMHMLVTLVEELRDHAEHSRYTEAAALLEAVSGFLSLFEPYSAIPKIAELRSTVDQIRADLSSKIFDAFRRIGALASSVASPDEFQDRAAATGEFTTLNEACLVVNALGPEAVKRQIEAILNEQLIPYRSLPEFQRGGDAASLDQIDRRFRWLKRLLVETDKKFGDVFPSHWRVSHRLVLRFLSETRTQLLAVLQSGDPEVENVTILLKALQKSLSFEKEMEAQFEPDAASRGGDGNPDGEALDPNSPEGIRQKYERKRAAEQQGTTSPATSADKGFGGGEESLPRIVGWVPSSMFRPVPALTHVLVSRLPIDPAWPGSCRRSLILS